MKALQCEYSPRKDSSLLTPLYSLTKSELIKNESELVENKSELRLTGRDARRASAIRIVKSHTENTDLHRIFS